MTPPPGGAEPWSGFMASGGCQVVAGRPGTAFVRTDASPKKHGEAAGALEQRSRTAKRREPGQRQKGTLVAAPHDSRSRIVGKGARNAPAPSSGEPGRALRGARHGRDQEGLVEGEPGAGGRGFYRDKTRKKGGSIEIGGNCRSLARSERGNRGTAAGGTIAGPTPWCLGWLGLIASRFRRGGQLRCVGGHVVTDKPIAAAGLGRLDRAQNDQHQHRHDPAGAEKPRQEVLGCRTHGRLYASGKGRGRGDAARDAKAVQLTPGRNRSPTLPEESIDRPIDFKHFFRRAPWRHGRRSKRSFWYDPPIAMPVSRAGTVAGGDGRGRSR